MRSLGFTLDPRATLPLWWVAICRTARSFGSATKGATADDNKGVVAQYLLCSMCCKLFPINQL